MISVQYILTKKQREKFLKIPIDISDWDIAKYYTFTKKELEIIGNRRRQYNKIGFALQLSALKHPGWSYSKARQFPLSVSKYIAQQIKVNPSEICNYPKKIETLSEHFIQVKNFFEYRNFEKRDEDWLFDLILELALENDNPLFLVKCAIVQI